MRIINKSLWLAITIVFGFCLLSCEKKVDYKTASKEELVKLAEEKEDVEAMLQLGRNAILKDTKDLETASKYFKMAADKGNGTGFYNYYVVKDYLKQDSLDSNQKFELLKKAYELGSHRAQSMYGFTLIKQSENNLIIIDPDKFEEGLKLCEEAANKYDDAEAYSYLGLGTIIKNQGNFDEGDVSEQYFIKGIERGSYTAFATYLILLMKANPPYTKAELLQKTALIKNNYPHLYKWNKKLLETGSAEELNEDERYELLKSFIE